MVADSFRLAFGGTANHLSALNFGEDAAASGDSAPSGRSPSPNPRASRSSHQLKGSNSNKTSPASTSTILPRGRSRSSRPNYISESASRTGLAPARPPGRAEDPSPRSSRNGAFDGYSHRRAVPGIPFPSTVGPSRADDRMGDGPNDAKPYRAMGRRVTTRERTSSAKGLSKETARAMTPPPQSKQSANNVSMDPARPTGPTASEELSTLTINIHMAEAFSKSQVVADPSKIPWAKAGDILRVRPASERRNGLAYLETGGTKLGGENTSAPLGGRASKGVGRSDTRKHRKDFLFKLKEPSETDPNRRNGVNYPALSVSETVAHVFDFTNRSEVYVTKADPADVEADYIELFFTGQYLGRADMWRLGMSLEDKCVHVREKVEFAGIIRAEVRNIFRNGKKVASGLVTSRTKTVYRSKSAQAYIFIQLCREMWEFDEDGERYYEKALHGFLPELFERWKGSQTSHVVTVILFARVFYDDLEMQYLRQLGHQGTEALMFDKHAGWYKDFYKCLVDWEMRADWSTVLPLLKVEMLQTHEEILLTHHLDEDEAKEAKLVGRLGYAFEGNVLECLNLVLNPFDESYIDRDLSRTGLCITVITPGAGHFAVNKDLLRLTMERMLEHGICLDLVCLTQIPLHITPLFSFWSKSPPSVQEGVNRASDKSKGQDILYYDGGLDDETEEKCHFSLAFWVYCHFYSKTHDRPFREDRFVPRCKMYEIQMLGVMDHDLTTLALPVLELAADNHTGFDEALFSSMQSEDGQQGNTISSHESRGELWRTRSKGSGSDISVKHASYRSQKFLPALLEATVAESESETHLKAVRSTEKRPLVSEKRPLAPTTADVVTPPETARVPQPTSSQSVSKDKTLSRESTISSKVSYNSSRAGSGWAGGMTKLYNRFMSRAPPSQATAAPAVAERRDVSHSPNSLARRRAFSPPKTTTGSIRGTPMASPQATRTPAIPKAESSSPSAGKQGPNKSRIAQADGTAAAIAIPIRGASVESKRRTLRSDSQVKEQDANGDSAAEQLSRSINSARNSYTGESNQRKTQLETGNPEINPCRPLDRKLDRTGQAKRWQHALPRPTFQQDVKWDSLCAPACLPLTNGLIPTDEELLNQYREQLYVFDVHANQLSFLLRNDVEDLPIAVMREMASQRLSQNFQFIVSGNESRRRRTDARVTGIRPGGASEVLRRAKGPLWLSTPNQVHRLDFAMENRNTLEVHNYTRNISYSTRPYPYTCLVWPRQRKAYQSAEATFRYPLRTNDFNYLDRLIAGAEEELTDSVRYWRTRFILIPSDKPPPTMTASTGEALTTEEIMILGATRLLELIGKNRWTKRGQKPQPVPKLLPTWLDPSACVTDESLMEQLDRIHTGRDEISRPEKRMTIKDSSLEDIAKAMKDPSNGLQIYDRWWQKILYADSFQGDAFVTWLMAQYSDLRTRELATEWGNKLQKQGLIEHCDRAHGFLDGYYFYRLTDQYARSIRRKRGLGWFSKAAEDPSDKRPAQQPPALVNPKPQQRKRRKIQMSQTMILDIDPPHRSDRAEVAILHADVIHNPANAFHFELNWIGVTAGLLDDIRQRWSAVAERHGLRLVEAPVEQIKDVGKKCAYRACFPIKLALAPPAITDLDERLPEKIRTTNFFEYAILTKKFGFVLDVEATSRYPENVDVEYSYRQAAIFDHSQFVHRSGVGLVQCAGGLEGFLWSDNRLFFSASSRYRSEQFVTIDGQTYTRQQQADKLRGELERFCSDPKALAEFYESVLPPVFAPEDISQLPESEDVANSQLPSAKTKPALDPRPTAASEVDMGDYTGPYGL